MKSDHSPSTMLSTRTAIWLLMTLNVRRTINKFKVGKKNNPILSFLGIIFLLFIVSVLIGDMVYSLQKKPFIDQKSFFSLTSLILSVFFISSEFALQNKDAGTTEEEVHWLMTLPVSMSTISLMKISRTALFNVSGVLFLFPLISIQVYANAGPLWIIPALMLIYVPFVLCLATVVHLIDMMLGFVFTSKTRKYFTLLFGLLMFVSYLSLYMLHSASDSEGIYKRVLNITHELSFLDWIPIFDVGGLAITYTNIPADIGTVYGLFLLNCFGIIFIIGVLINRFTAHGLRERRESDDRSHSLTLSHSIRGIVGKEILLIKREKRLWFSLLLPFLLIVVNQYFYGIEIKTTNDAILQGFFVGLVIPISAIPILALKERESMWLGFTFPQSLSEQLFRKMLFWAMISGVISFCTVVGYIILFQFPFVHLHKIVMVPIFLICISSVFYGIRLSSQDYMSSLDSQRVEKSGVGTIYLLIGSAALALYINDMVFGFITVFLFVVFALSVWQRNTTKLPHLLDPEHEQYLSVSIEHGLCAVLGFFMLQNLFMTVIGESESIQFPSVVSFALSGIVVYILSFVHFWLNGAIDMKKVFGFQRPRSWFGVGKESIRFASLSIISLFLYKLVLDYFTIFAPPEILMADKNEYAIGAIFLAPIFEEFIFRGMLYSGFRKDRGVLFSIVLSATLFAIVHPVYSWPIVFLVGVCCCYAYERTESLLAPMIVHLLYNSVAIGFMYLS